MYKPEHPPDVPGVTVIRPVNKRFTDAVGYQDYRLIKQSKRYKEDGANDLNMMTKNTTAQRKDQTFSAKGTVSMIAFVQNFEAAGDVCNIHEVAAM